MMLEYVFVGVAVGAVGGMAVQYALTGWLVWKLFVKDGERFDDDSVLDCMLVWPIALAAIATAESMIEALRSGEGDPIPGDTDTDES